MYSPLPFRTAAGRSFCVRFAHLAREGLHLTLKGGELCGLHGKVMRCGVVGCIIFVLEIIEGYTNMKIMRGPATHVRVVAPP
jgi:hypothetical protein